MVKIGKIFGKKGRTGDDASVISSLPSKKFSRRSPAPSPTPEVNMTFAASSPPAAIPEDAPADAAPVAPPTLNNPSTKSGSSSRKVAGKKSKSRSPPLPSPPYPVPEEETRDEAPSPTIPMPADPVSQDPVEDNLHSTSSSVEPSFEETVDQSEEEASETYDDSGTVETYEEEVSTGTADEKSTFEDDFTYEETTHATQQENATVTTGATRGTHGTVKGNEASKKYFHKDVVLNSLEDGANSLVIRAMYFIPKPKADDHVVVKIEASTISARDCMKCKGHGLSLSMLPFVPGFEVVGTIQTLGDKSKQDGEFREGDRVAGVSTFGGGNSRFISIPANRLTKISNNVKSTLAVCMIHDYMAALKALRLAKKAGSPFTGMNILITDGFSPVGQAVISLASMEGANIYCCADESKHSYLVGLGAKCFIKNPEAWLPTASSTFDIVIDNSCLDSYSSSWFALTKKGALVCLAPVYNIDNDDMPNSACGLDITELQQNWAGLKAKYMMTQTSFLDTTSCYDDDTEQYKQDLRYLMFLLERGDIKPKVAERVSLDDVPDAQRLMQSGRANGTVVCVPWIEE